MADLNIVKNIKKIAERVLLNEAKSIAKIAELIDDEFEKCVLEILNLKGHVIVTGIGKSAIVANKIVSTLNSTGTPSIFMHAADAIHGDLGMVQPGDVVICISKSGNTPELKLLLPLLRRSEAKVIALVSNVHSFLADKADFILNATVDEEAYPNVMAPTTSTSAHMALGDALAISLLEARGFSKEDFARFHPGGALGKQLYLKVKDIMVTKDLPIVHIEAYIKEVIIAASSKRFGSAAIVDDQQNLVGIVTDGDLRRMLEKHSEISNIYAKQIMNKKPKTIGKDDYVVKALNAMEDNNILQLIVEKNQKVVGFIHLHDILKEGIF